MNSKRNVRKNFERNFCRYSYSVRCLIGIFGKKYWNSSSTNSRKNFGMNYWNSSRLSFERNLRGILRKILWIPWKTLLEIAWRIWEIFRYSSKVILARIYGRRKEIVEKITRVSSSKTPESNPWKNSGRSLWNSCGKN